MKTVALLIKDPVLDELVREQLARISGLEIGEEGAGMVIAQDMTDRPLPHLLLGGRPSEGHESLPLPLRLGDLTDRTLYLLSGRDRFAADRDIEFSGLTLSAEDGLLSAADGRNVRLTDKEKLILLSLYDAPDHSLDRLSLLTHVWGYAETAETHTLETHLYRLRQKLEEAFNARDIIVTRDGIYTLQT